MWYKWRWGTYIKSVLRKSILKNFKYSVYIYIDSGVNPSKTLQYLIEFRNISIVPTSAYIDAANLTDSFDNKIRSRDTNFLKMLSLKKRLFVCYIESLAMVFDIGRKQDQQYIIQFFLLGLLSSLPISLALICNNWI